MQIPSPSRDRRNAQPLRCSLASLPLSHALPVFHSSSSSSVAHSSSIKPAPLVRLLLDIPEVKHLHPSVTSTQQTRCTHRIRISPLHLTITAHPTTASPLACLQLDCIRILPPLAHVSFQTRTTNRTRHARGHSPDHLCRATLETSLSKAAINHFTTPPKPPCLLSEAPQRPSRSRPSDLTKRTRRGTRT